MFIFQGWLTINVYMVNIFFSFYNYNTKGKRIRKRGRASQLDKHKIN